MKAGIIAAGEGSRLRTEGIDTPKPLISLDGVTLIERLLRRFEEAGVTDVVCIVNEYSTEVKEFVEARKFRMPVQFAVQTTPSSMHSLFALAPFLGEERFLLSTVDSVFDPVEFMNFMAHGRVSNADGILAVTKFIDDESPLYVEMDDAMRIHGFSKSERSPWVTGGLYILSPRVFREINHVLALKIERLRNFFGHLVASNYHLEAFPFSKIVDVDHASDIRTAESLLRAHSAGTSR